MRRITAGAAFAGAALGLCAAGATPAFAADLVVGRGKPFTTIQAAVDAAGPGDRILVGPGVYKGAVSIPSGKDGLQLIGRRATIDGHAEDGTPQRPLRVYSEGVVVQGFTLRNGVSDTVEAYADDFTLRKCRIRTAEEVGVYVGGDRAVIDDCEFRGMAERALRINGADARVTGVRISHSGGGGVYVTGSNALVDDVDIRLVDGEEGVGVRGDHATVRRVRITNVHYQGITVDGDFAVVEGCTIDNVTSIGVAVVGATIRVTGNTVRDCGETGISLHGGDVEASRNTVSSIGAGNTGISVRFDDGVMVPTPRILLEDNAVADTYGFGYSVVGSASVTAPVTLRRNSARRTGAGSAGGFHVVAGPILLEDCTSWRAGDTAFQIEPVGAPGAVQITRCVADSALGDGFQVSAPDATLTGCRATKCGGEGIHNAGPNTTLNDCTFAKNRIDVANDPDFPGAFANDITLDNEFGTGGPTTVPEVDGIPSR